MAADPQISARVRIGDAFQAAVPSWTGRATTQDGLNGDTAAAAASVLGGERVWDWERGQACGVEQYIERLQQHTAPGAGGISVERALELLRQCEYDADRATALALATPSLRVLDGSPDAWDAGECRLFEYAYMRFGSDFYAIADFMRPRTVAEVQQHYYTWKNSAAYMRFCARCAAECQAPSEPDDSDETDTSEVGSDSCTVTQVTTAAAPAGSVPTAMASSAVRTTTAAVVATMPSATADNCDFDGNELRLPVQGPDECYCCCCAGDDGSGNCGAEMFDDDDEAAAEDMSALTSPLSPPPTKRQHHQQQHQHQHQPEQQHQQQELSSVNSWPFH